MVTRQLIFADMIVVMAFENLRNNVNEYVKGKIWYWHIPLWLFGVYFFVQLFSFDLTKDMPFVLAVPHAFDFMLHEIAHVFTGWLPPLITAASGSGSELILGLLLVYGAFQFHNYFASLYCFLWLALVCMSVGSYMADAIPQQIPLVSLGGAMAGSEQTTHDWNFIFGELNLLGASAFIGGAFKVMGYLAGLFGIIFSGWVMYKMAVGSDKKAMTVEDLEALKAKATPPAAQQTNKSVYPTPVKGNLSTTGAPPPNGNGNGENKQPPGQA